MNEVFTFVDASHLITKANLWEERDEAIRQKYEKLNFISKKSNHCNFIS